jgi:indolepyruvate ferredoxin oxidoreductase
VVLHPAGVAEILEYGLYGIAMSRFSGAWVALKCVHDTVESTATIEVAPDRPQIRLPEDYSPPPGGLNIRWPDHGLGQSMALAQEERLEVHKLEAARAFARANRLDRVVLESARPQLCLVTTGKSYLDVIAALDLLELTPERAAGLGLRIFKIGMTWPLEPKALMSAVAGVERVLVVEEKRPLIEDQMRVLLYDSGQRPLIEGKRDRHGAVLFPAHGALAIETIALAIGRRLLEAISDRRLAERTEAIARALATGAPRPAMVRLPWFCAGCPHNTSTRVPEGSRALAGIGCHFMVQWMDRATETFTQMGGEGASWLGQAPFTARPHIFQNVGDGTFYHSGSLAVRAAIAAGANITFKILYNDAVAMTGGQKMEIANLTVPQIAQLLRAEGVKEIAVVTDEPGKYPIAAGFPHGVRIYHRDELDAVQRRLREVPGVTAIIYDQTCAAEKRRRRKRGEFPDPPERVFIHEDVCEGCGDCGVQSNWVAILPKETAFGRKRQIDQSACNKDYSCIRGFCPSFVSVRGASLKRQAVAVGDLPFPPLPDPELPPLDRPYGIVVTGIGGTGVVTVAAILGMAAHLEGKAFAGLDMVGLAQKGGAVISFAKIARHDRDIGAPRVARGSADLLLGCDLVVAAGNQALLTLSRGRSRAIVNAEETLTGQFTRDPDLAFPAETLKANIVAAVGEKAAAFVDATRMARALLGESIGANLFLVGYAFQKGLLPVSAEAILRAIELNGVAVALNRAAFTWGRRAAHDPQAVEAILRRLEPPTETPPADLDALIAHRARHLEAWQDAAWARRYVAIVERIRRREAEILPGREQLTRAVAISLAKLMSYKDEYEVARLYADPAFEARLRAQFDSWQRLEFHLAPPLLATRDPMTGQLQKRRFGPWVRHVFRLLARMKRLRGTVLDPFGWTAERRRERALIRDYERILDEILDRLAPENYAVAVELARLPERIRGFGHIKEAAIRRFEAERETLLARLRGERVLLRAAE